MTALAPYSARPPGNVPKGSPYGLFAIGVSAGVVPFLVLQSLVPVIKDGTDIWLASILPVLGASGVVGTIIAVGLHRRRFWYICLVFTLGSVLLAAYLAGLGLSLAILGGFVPEESPDLKFMSVVNIIDWLVISPLPWVLLRMLRLRYWQPWTTPDQWEPPGPVPPTRTLLMTWAQRKR